MRQKVYVLEMWSYRRLLKISYRDRITNKEVLRRIHIELHFRKDMIRRKMKYAEHVLRGSAGVAHLQILEGESGGSNKERQAKRYVDTGFVKLDRNKNLRRIGKDSGRQR